MGRYRSGQTGQTVNLLAYAFQGSNPCLPTKKKHPNRGVSFCYEANCQAWISQDGETAPRAWAAVKTARMQ
jgi:hypothetical protein